MARVPRLGDGVKKTNSMFYLKRAKQYCVQNDFTKAYENFVNYFESLNNPSEATITVKTVFTRLVCKIGTVLEETDNVEELLKCYIQTLNLFPNNYVILNNLGAYMFKLGEISIARTYLERAVKCNPNYLPAEKNLMHLQWHELPRWHFRMLNDKSRNAAYKNAIDTLVGEGYTNVVDIGAGCGLLSLYAARNPDTKVYAIEQNKVLANMCKDVLQTNNIKNVEVQNIHSSSLAEPVGECNLLVTETFDVALLGERALESIHHALTILTTDEDFKVIPYRARLYAAGINCEQLIIRHKYIHQSNLDFLNMQKFCLIQSSTEPYDAEYMKERKNLKIMTESVTILDVELNNLDQIEEILYSQGEQKSYSLRCIKDGEIHAIMTWFDLYLTEDIIISTNPVTKESVNCWEQAIFYLDHPVTVNKDNLLPITTSVNDCKVNIVAETKNDHECYTVSKEMISFLNDKKLIASFLDLLTSYEGSFATAVDYNVFPVVGLVLAKTTCRVYHVLKNDNDRPFFEQLLAVNGIPADRFIMTAVDNPLEGDPTDQQTLYIFDLVNTDGSLSTDVSRRKAGITSSIILPKAIRIKVIMISSLYIEHCNKVDDKNLFGFQIAKHMNKYTGFEHPNLEYVKLCELSEPVSFKFENDGEKVLPATVKRSGIANALYTWYEIRFYHDIVFSTKDSSHYKKTCYFLKKWISVKQGDILDIKMAVDNCYLKFNLNHQV